MKADRDQESTQKLPEAISQGEFSRHDTERLAFPAASLVAVRQPPMRGQLKASFFGTSGDGPAKHIMWLN
jgi:hypothetical protein